MAAVIELDTKISPQQPLDVAENPFGPVHTVLGKSGLALSINLLPAFTVTAQLDNRCQPASLTLASQLVPEMVQFPEVYVIQKLLGKTELGLVFPDPTPQCSITI
jgi:hypothetical protein